MVSIDLAHAVLGAEQSTELDLFTRVQLNTVLEVCRRSHSLADAGRKLIAVTGRFKERANDSNRLRKYLQRYNLTWEKVR